MIAAGAGAFQNRNIAFLSLGIVVASRQAVFSAVFENKFPIPDGKWKSQNVKFRYVSMIAKYMQTGYPRQMNEGKLPAYTSNYCVFQDRDRQRIVLSIDELV